MDFLDLLSDFSDLLGPFLVRGLNGGLISIKKDLHGFFINLEKVYDRPPRYAPRDALRCTR